MVKLYRYIGLFLTFLVMCLLVPVGQREILPYGIPPTLTVFDTSYAGKIYESFDVDYKNMLDIWAYDRCLEKKGIYQIDCYEPNSLSDAWFKYSTEKATFIKRYPAYANAEKTLSKASELSEKEPDNLEAKEMYINAIATASKEAAKAYRDYLVSDLLPLTANYIFFANLLCLMLMIIVFRKREVVGKAFWKTITFPFWLVYKAITNIHKMV